MARAGAGRFHLLLKSAALSAAVFALSLASAAVRAQGAGYWHTSGSQILDANGSAVRIAGINWFGFETKDEIAHGLFDQDYRQILHTISTSGFNTIRLPFSNQMVENPIVPSFENAQGTINGDLAGLNSLEIMDKIIAAAGVEGLKVILDDHRSEAGNSNESSGLWYTRAYPESSWIADWEMLARRYSSFKDVGGNPVVIGMDLRNEPYSMVNGVATGSCWTGDTKMDGCPVTNKAHNWPQAAGRAATAILNINSNLLIFVEGVDCYSGSCDWQGGNLEGADRFPVELSYSGHLVYSAHDYGPQVSPQPWFNDATTNASLQQLWTKHWAYLAMGNAAPVWLGEFGTSNKDRDIESNARGSQGQWFAALVNFLRAQPRIGWAYWAVNGEDGSGLLKSDYSAQPRNSLKMEELTSIQFPLKNLGGSEPPNTATATAADEAGKHEASPHRAIGFRDFGTVLLAAFAFVLVGRKQRRSGGEEQSPSAPGTGAST